MTIVHRRIFYGKIGKAHEIIQHIREGDEMLRSRGYEFPSRVLADFQSGRTDRVAVEWRAGRVGEFEEVFEGLMEDPEARAEMAPWLDRLNGLIHYAEAENWTLH